jgi:hypothetical protein
MSGKTAPVLELREPRGTVQHEGNPEPGLPLVAAGSGAMPSQAALPVGTISRTRQIPRSDAIEAAGDNLSS